MFPCSSSKLLKAQFTLTKKGKNMQVFFKMLSLLWQSFYLLLVSKHLRRLFYQKTKEISYKHFI